MADMATNPLGRFFTVCRSNWRPNKKPTQPRITHTNGRRSSRVESSMTFRKSLPRRRPMRMNSAPVKRVWTANGSFPETNARRDPTRASTVSTIAAMSAFISGDVSFRS